ncbi:phosphoesterase [Crateriforma spongiae]|uniref:phosphoesterase n=1 Tax=Crateriforma spongiae TaxID=2724528 RepID=UPI0014478656|nr:phosphoesterase [Crateriforma spongiae]
MSADEQILVIPESFIDSIGTIDGFQRDVDRFLDPILQSDQLTFGRRGDMETDPSFKQLIPYVVLQWNDDNDNVHVFTYTRGGGSGEARLHAKRSIGIGGHISAEDAQGDGNPYLIGMQRELDEEVEIDTAYQDVREGLLYDPSNDVGKVHLGIVHRFVLQSPSVKSREDDLAEGGFVPLDELRNQFERLETWSQLTLTALYG